MKSASVRRTWNSLNMCVDFVAHLLNRDEEMALEPAGAIFQWLSFKNGFRQIFFSFSTVLMMGPSTRAYAKQLPPSLKYEIDFHSCCDETIPGACTRWPSASLLTYTQSRSGWVPPCERSTQD